VLAEQSHEVESCASVDDGLVARLLRGPMRKQLDQGLAKGLRYLKIEVERKTTPQEGIR
jgi:hypothetical protein